MPRSTSAADGAGAEVLAVRVPAAVGQGDAADAGFDETAGGQELLDAPVAVATWRVFALEVEGVRGRRPR